MSTAVVVGSLAFAGDGPAADAPWASWAGISLDARGGAFVSGRVDIDRDDRTVRMRTLARFLGAKIADSTSVTTRDPESGATLRFEQRSRKRARVYAFDGSGYTVEKFRPPRDPDRPLDEWERYHRERFEYPLDEGGRAIAATDYTSMLVDLGGLGLEAIGDSTRLLVATSDGPQPFTVEVVERRRSERRVSIDDARATIPTEELRLRVTPEDEEAEGLMEMRGSTEIWIESGSGTLLHLEGDLPKLPGRLKLTIDRVRRARASSAASATTRSLAERDGDRQPLAVP